jgi:class 3 adenylate cyclase
MTLAGNDHGSARRLNERRHLIVMFCDVVDSTRLSRKRDVETYYSVLRAYYDACRAVVARHGGFVAQHHGDGIYIWFGYPQPHEDDALRAVRAGLDLLGVLHRVSAGFDGEAGEPFQVRIAAPAGEVLVAPVEHESGPLAFGHTPNLAAKLQQVTPRPGTVLRDGVVVAAHEVVREHRRPGRIAAGWQTPLVGRDREVERLQALWSDVRDGPGDVVAIVGDRGVGKTRLASTLTALAAEDGATVLDCASNRLDARTAYRTMRVLLAAAAGIGPDDQSVVGAARLRDHLQGTLGMDDVASSVLGASLGLARGAELPAPSVDPRRLAQLTADTLVEWLRRLAARTPTIVAIDDIADADPSSMEILARLAAEPLPHLLIVVTAYSVTSLPDGLSTPHTRILELSPLSEDDADALVAVVTAAAPLELHVSERIVRQGEGIPLYLEELARTAQEADDTALPITLTGYLQARIAASAADREVVGVLAAAGRAVEEAVLTAVLEVDDAGLRDGLAGLMARDLVVHLTDDGSHYRFRHGLIAEAAYGLLLHDDRTRLHGRLADAMIDRHGRGQRLDWNVVGRHLDLAGRPVEAADALLNGADEARGAGANHEALQGYQDVLDVLEKIADAGVRDRLEVRCRMRRGAAAIAARGWGADEAISAAGWDRDRSTWPR